MQATTTTRSSEGADRGSHAMNAKRLRAIKAHPSASAVRVDRRQTVPSYLQRYSAELDAWHAQRRAATSTPENDPQTGAP